MIARGVWKGDRSLRNAMNRRTFLKGALSAIATGGVAEGIRAGKVAMDRVLVKK